MEAFKNLVSEMTIAELAQKSQRSIEDLVAWAMETSDQPSAAPRRRKAPPTVARTPKAAKAVKAGEVNTRSPAGRAEYEANVFKAVQKASGPISAQEVRSAVGGTPQQARAALNRLIEQGKLSFEGKARATRYFAA